VEDDGGAEGFHDIVRIWRGLGVGVLSGGNQICSLERAVGGGCPLVGESIR